MKHMIVAREQGKYRICVEASPPSFETVNEVFVEVKIHNELALDEKLEKALSTKEFEETGKLVNEVM